MEAEYRVLYRGRLGQPAPDGGGQERPRVLEGDALGSGGRVALEASERGRLERSEATET